MLELKICFVGLNCTQHIKFSPQSIGIRFRRFGGQLPLPGGTCQSRLPRSRIADTRGHIPDCLRTQFLLSADTICAAWGIVSIAWEHNLAVSTASCHWLLCRGLFNVSCRSVINRTSTKKKTLYRFQHTFSIQNLVFSVQIVLVASWLVLLPDARVTETTFVVELIKLNLFEANSE